MKSREEIIIEELKVGIKSRFVTHAMYSPADKRWILAGREFAKSKCRGARLNYMLIKSGSDQ